MSLETHWQPSPEARIAESEDGTTLMNVRSGKYFALNPVAARIWSRLDQGEAPSAILDHLRESYEVPEARLRADLEQVLDRLAKLGLVIEAHRSESLGFGPDAPALAPASGSRLPPDIGRALRTDLPPIRLGEPATTGSAQVPAHAVARGWATLLLLDLLLRGFGFHRFYRFVRQRRVHGALPEDLAGEIARTRAAVDRAARLYLKQAWCLQRSAATTWLLRRRGVPADLVIGLRHLPFMAHAWVEVDGHTINDDPRVIELYQVIERC